MKTEHKEIRSFFNYLDKYLIKDLQTMAYEIPSRPKGGGLGYPLMQTIISSMELLGMVLSDGLNDANAFDNFWNNYFVINNNKYNNESLRKIFRNSVRNGIAHYFLVKAGIHISKEHKGHLIRTADRLLNIDCLNFFDDFNATYSEIKSRLFSGDPDLVQIFKTGHRHLLSDLKASFPEVEKYSKYLQVNTRQTTTYVTNSNGTASYTQNIGNLPITTTLPYKAK
jgi:hypothetical protein